MSKVKSVIDKDVWTTPTSQLYSFEKLIAQYFYNQDNSTLINALPMRTRKILVEECEQ